jgi:hypothetical protein
MGQAKPAPFCAPDHSALHAAAVVLPALVVFLKAFRGAPARSETLSLGCLAPPFRLLKEAFVSDGFGQQVFIHPDLDEQRQDP